MLEQIREGSQGLTAKIILGLIILTFAVAGIGDYSSSVDTSVAEVNGEKISQNDFEKSFRAQRNRLAQQYGEMFEKLAADESYMIQLRQNALDTLINEKVVEQYSADMAIRVSDAQIKETIRNMKEFQVDGVFDNSRYLALIQQAGFYQSSDFRDYLRTEMTRRQLTQAVIASEFTLPYQAKALNALKTQTRDIKYSTIKAAQFESTVEITEEEVSAYYQENTTRYENPEQVKVDYIVLNVEDLAKGIEVSEDDVNAYYQDNIAQYTELEQRKISHILVEFGDDEAAAQTKAEAFLARLNNNEDFAELAKTSSDDTYSGEQGGDLDWYEVGTTDDAFEQAVLALTLENNLSGVVKAESGFHIIKLTDYKAESVQALAGIYDEVAAKVSTAKAEEEFYALKTKMNDLSYEFPDSLDDAAQAIDSEVQTSAWLKRGINEAPFDNPTAIEAAFSDLVLTEQVNSEIIEVSDSLAMVIRLNEYQAANLKPLAEVSEQIKAQLTKQKAAEQALEVADELLTAYVAGDDISEKLTSYDASFVESEKLARFGSAVNRAISKAAFELAHPQAETVSAKTVSLAGGDVAIVEVVNVNAGDSSENEASAEQQTSQQAISTYTSFIDSLVADASITRRTMAVSTN